MHALFTLLVPLFLACASAPEPAAPDAPSAPAKAEPMADRVTVSSPRARAMPPGTPNSGAFMTFHNAGPGPATLVGASAEVSATVELHTHVEEDGMMKMRAIPQIELPAGQDVVLAPGGLHVMFIGLKGALEVGQNIPLTLSFADGTSQQVDVPVQEIRGHGGGHGKHKGKGKGKGKGHGHGQH